MRKTNKSTPKKPTFIRPVKLDRYYFAYGSNTNLAQMAVRCPSAKALGVATLPEYALMMRGVADIEQVEGARCHGVLWHISKGNQATLDRYEGYPYFYDRKRIDVIHNGEKVSAIVYEMFEKSHTYRPTKAYYDKIKNGYKAFHINQVQLEDACDFSHRGLLGPYAARKENKIPHLHPQYMAYQKELDKQLDLRMPYKKQMGSQQDAWLQDDESQYDHYFTQPDNYSSY